MVNLKIDEEFKNLIPPLGDSEFSQLEENILQYGIQDPLKVWNGILIDGHNRYSIAQKHNLTFNVEEMNFDSRADVINWMIKNQFGRRNISAYDRVILALKLKSLLEKQADERKKAGVKIGDNLVPHGEQGRVVEQIAKMAGVGKNTVYKVEKIQEISKTIKFDDVIAGLKRGDISINLAYEAAILRKQKYDNIVEQARYKLLKLQEAEKGLRQCYEDLKCLTVPTNQLEELQKLRNGLGAILRNIDYRNNAIKITETEYRACIDDVKKMLEILNGSQ